MNATTTVTAQVASTLRTETGVYVNATCGKTSASIGISEFGVQVICLNAAHRAWRGSGRRFSNMREAMDAYRSAEMKAILSAADGCNS